MIKHPVIADNKPVKVNFTKGHEYHFCTCGLSKSQPFCDGSHVATPFTPRVIVADRDGEAVLCACKHTRHSPFCDGTHQAFSADQVGHEGPGITTADELAPAPRATAEEPTLEIIHQLARDGLAKVGRHGPVGAMGVPRQRLPHWDDIQIMVAQLQRRPLTEEADVQTGLVIGPESRKPLRLDIPLLVADMSFGALSFEAKLALAKGAELAGTGICSGEGGMLPEEQQANSRYFYELASARFGYDDDVLDKVQAFHFKAGQAAKTGTGGCLPAAKNVGRVAQVRGLAEGQPANSPAAFEDLRTADDFKRFADHVRDLSGGIPVGFKLSANHIERDIEFALQATADYLILDGRGGGTGAAPLLLRDHISVPTIAALARARHYLDRQGVSGKVTLIITGGLRVASDFVKALALGADGIAIANSAIQAVGCVAARMCHTNHCPAGVATQDPLLRQRINVERSAQRLANFLTASTGLMKVMARACGHAQLSQFNKDDLATFDHELSRLAGIDYAGFNADR